MQGFHEDLKVKDLTKQIQFKIEPIQPDNHLSVDFMTGRKGIDAQVILTVCLRLHRKSVHIENPANDKLEERNSKDRMSVNE